MLQKKRKRNELVESNTRQLPIRKIRIIGRIYDHHVELHTIDIPTYAGMVEEKNKHSFMYVNLSITTRQASCKKIDFMQRIIVLLPMAMYRKNNHGVINDSFGFRGGRSIISKSGGLKPSAVAGKPSVTKFTQSN